MDRHRHFFGFNDSKTGNDLKSIFKKGEEERPITKLKPPMYDTFKKRLNPHFFQVHCF